MNGPRRPLRITIGLPQSSQSMSVVIGPVLAGALPSAPIAEPPVSLSIISCERAAPSLSSGTSASTCANASPSSFFIIFVERHFGNVLHPRNGPRLLSRSSIGLPHFSHATDVLIGLGFGGSGLPSLSRLMIVEQLGSPFSFFTE